MKTVSIIFVCLNKKNPNFWNYTKLLVILLLLAICCSVFWAMTYYFSRFQKSNFPFHMWKKDIAVAQISCACTPTLYCMPGICCAHLLCIYTFTMYLYICQMVGDLPLWISKCCQTWDRFFSTIQHRSFFYRYYREQKKS